MNQRDIEQYCKDNGVPYRLVGDHLRVMDLTQLPEGKRTSFDERGFFIPSAPPNPPEVEPLTEVEEIAEPEDAVKDELVDDELPEDFPGSAALTEAGYGSKSEVRAATDVQLLAVDHIGPKVLEKIREALEADK